MRTAPPPDNLPVASEEGRPAELHGSLDPAALESLADLAHLFAQVYARLAAEGYRVENGRIIPPASSLGHEDQRE